MHTRRWAGRATGLLGSVGFSALTVALLVAHWNPATEYELSVYAATPTAFWVGVGVAFLAALVIAISADDVWYRRGALLLGGLAALAVVSLPIIRGYYFEGIHDPLTHVGWTRALLEGTMVPHDVVYPAIHTLGTFVAGVTGFSVWRSAMFVPRVVILVFFVFVPLAVREIVGDGTGAAIGAFSAFLLIPVHLIANHVHAHPSSQTVLFAPLAIYLVFRYLGRADSTPRVGIRTPFGVLLVVVTMATILFHPQQALNLVVLLGTIAAVQFVASRRGSFLRWTHRRPIYSIAAVAIVVYVAWILRFAWIPQLVQDTVTTVVNFGTSGPNPGSAIDSQTFALQAIGASLPVIFVKMFLVSTVYLAITSVVLVLALRGQIGTSRVRADATDVLRILCVVLVALLPAFVLYFLGDVSVYYFRQAGFVTMLATIVGAVGITYWIRGDSTPGVRGAARPMAIVGLAVLLALSTMILFPSPYIHKSSQHVTEARVSGYETAFQVTGESAFMAGVRQEPERYHEALVTVNETGRHDGGVNSTEIHRLRQLRGDSWYLMMSQNTYEREIVAYREYRYSRADLASVRRQVGVNLVHSNGDAELYYVRGR